jgi:hypothetical protein
MRNMIRILESVLAGSRPAHGLLQAVPRLGQSSRRGAAGGGHWNKLMQVERR